jgi:hypothetical protein
LIKVYEYPDFIRIELRSKAFANWKTARNEWEFADHETAMEFLITFLSAALPEKTVGFKSNNKWYGLKPRKNTFTKTD